MRSLFALTVFMLVSLSAAAGAYRWTDDKGQVHYGDRPPNGQAERLKLPTSAPETASEEATEEATQAPADASKETPFSQGKENASAQERCDEFKARVKRYQNAGDMFIDNPDGTRHKMADEERQKLIQRTQSQADSACADVY